MLTAAWLMLGTLLYSLQLNTGSFPRPLSEAEERHYLTLAKTGDLEARNILIERNLRLVAHIMKKYYTQSADQEDLISIGTIGLIKGIETFDASKGARLATYAARCVENAILSPETFRDSSLRPKAENALVGISRNVYIDIECGATKQIPGKWYKSLRISMGFPRKISWMTITDSFQIDNQTGFKNIAKRPD